VGMMGRVLSFTRTLFGDANASDVVIDMGGGKVVTAPHFATPGDDSHPLPSDYSIISRNAQTGGYVVVGYIDPVNAGIAGLGDKRTYARDSDGNIIASIWQKNDGTIRAENASGYFELESGGDCVLNGVRIDTTGLITTPTGIVTPSAEVNGKELDAHDHDITSGSSAPGPTGPNN